MINPASDWEDYYNTFYAFQTLALDIVRTVPKDERLKLLQDVRRCIVIVQDGILDNDAPNDNLKKDIHTLATGAYGFIEGVVALDIEHLTHGGCR
jgi:hypothetical protein